MPDFGQMMQNPNFQRLIRNYLMQKRKKKPQDLLGGRGNNAFANLGKQLPKFQKMQEQWKMEDADRKAKKLRLDFMTKRAEEQSGQDQIQAARDSV